MPSRDLAPSPSTPAQPIAGLDTSAVPLAENAVASFPALTAQGFAPAEAAASLWKVEASRENAQALGRCLAACDKEAATDPTMAALAARIDRDCPGAGAVFQTASRKATSASVPPQGAALTLRALGQPFPSLPAHPKDPFPGGLAGRAKSPLIQMTEKVLPGVTHVVKAVDAAHEAIQGQLEGAALEAAADVARRMAEGQDGAFEAAFQTELDTLEPPGGFREFIRDGLGADTPLVASQVAIAKRIAANLAIQDPRIISALVHMDGHYRAFGLDPGDPFYRDFALVCERLRGQDFDKLVQVAEAFRPLLAQIETILKTVPDASLEERVPDDQWAVLLYKSKEGRGSKTYLGHLYDNVFQPISSGGDLPDLDVRGIVNTLGAATSIAQIENGKTWVLMRAQDAARLSLFVRGQM
jgi:hypothetical protein